MTIILTKPVRVGGVELAAATTQTFAADVEADLVSRASAAYTINPTIGQGGVPVMTVTSNSAQGVAYSAGGLDVTAQLTGDIAGAIRNAGLSWVWKSDATATQIRGSWWVYVPVGGGWYNYFAFSNDFNLVSAPKGWTLGRIGLARMAQYVRHDAPGVVKTGAWTDFTPLDGLFGKSLSRSTTPGNTITFPVRGDTLVARVAALTNAGYYVCAIDGDYTAANRLPTFTDADYTAGKCRAVDVGRRYLCLFYHSIVGDLHIPLAEGLSDTQHSVTFEVCGTKPTAALDVRTVVSAVMGCSPSFASDTPGATRCFAHVETAFEAYDGPAAWSVVFEAEKSAANTWEFVIGTHGGEGSITGAFYADGVDITSSLAAGSYQAASLVQFETASTVATSDALGAPFATKKQRFTLSAKGLCPAVCDTSITFTAAKRVRSHYPLMATLWSVRMDGAGGALEQYRGRWSDYTIGSWDSAGTLPDTVTVSTNYGNVPAKFAVGTGPHGHQLLLTLLDGYNSVLHYTRAYNGVFVQRKTTREDKLYFERSSIQGIESFIVGDVARSVVGWGLKPKI